MKTYMYISSIDHVDWVPKPLLFFMKYWSTRTYHVSIIVATYTCRLSAETPLNSSTVPLISNCLPFTLPSFLRMPIKNAELRYESEMVERFKYEILINNEQERSKGKVNMEKGGKEEVKGNRCIYMYIIERICKHNPAWGTKQHSKRWWKNR